MRFPDFILHCPFRQKRRVSKHEKMHVHLDHIALLQDDTLSISSEGGEVADGVVDRDGGGETDT